MNQLRTPFSSPLSSLFSKDPLRDFLLRWDYTPSEMVFSPSFDVSEVEDGFKFVADLPGVAQEDLDISLEKGLLTISGKRSTEATKEDKAFFVAERTQGTFKRSFNLPDSIDTSAITADLVNGVLTLKVPRSKESMPKKISVAINS